MLTRGTIYGCYFPLAATRDADIMVGGKEIAAADDADTNAVNWLWWVG